MINNVVLVGRLTKDVDLRITTKGDSVGSFTLAIPRIYTNQSGERETDFINCIIWRKSSETLAKYSRKGSLIGITGHIQTRNYNTDGKRVYATEVIAENFQLLEKKQTNEERKNQDTNSPSASEEPGLSKFDKFNLEDNIQGFSRSIEIDNDDLPF